MKISSPVGLPAGVRPSPEIKRYRQRLSVTMYWLKSARSPGKHGEQISTNQLSCGFRTCCSYEDILKILKEIRSFHIGRNGKLYSDRRVLSSFENKNKSPTLRLFVSGGSEEVITELLSCGIDMLHYCTHISPQCFITK